MQMLHKLALLVFFPRSKLELARLIQLTHSSSLSQRWLAGWLTDSLARSRSNIFSPHSLLLSRSPFSSLHPGRLCPSLEREPDAGSSFLARSHAHRISSTTQNMKKKQNPDLLLLRLLR